MKYISWNLYANSISEIIIPPLFWLVLKSYTRFVALFRNPKWYPSTHEDKQCWTINLLRVKIYSYFHFFVHNHQEVPQNTNQLKLNSNWIQNLSSNSPRVQVRVPICMAILYEFELILNWRSQFEFNLNSNLRVFWIQIELNFWIQFEFKCWTQFEFKSWVQFEFKTWVQFEFKTWTQDELNFRI